MSSKGRSGYPTRAYDSYLSPTPMVRAALEQLKRLRPLFNPLTCLEPGCAFGVHLDAARIVYPGLVRTVGVDLDPDTYPGGVPCETELSLSHEWMQEDYLTWVPDTTFDLIATNPPFSLAHLFMYRAVPQLSSNGLGLFFERIGFLTTWKRRWGLWCDIALREVWICTRRPALIGAPYTDSTEYAYFLFDRGAPGTVVHHYLDW